MENLKLNIFDLVSKDEILSHRSSQDAFSNQTQDLRFGIDYDFIVESFFCEYKLDTKLLKTIQIQYSTSTDPIEKSELENQFRSLYPECTDTNIAKANIPDTILKKAYFDQSPKGTDGLPAVHKSLKEKMLSDLRATRSKVKGDMKRAALAHDSVSETRFNAKQLAIKVVCNSEYGAANNEYFAHYDPDVASAVTRGARRLINFLTTNLESDHLFVDQKFLNEFKPQIDNLSSIEVLSVEQMTPNDVANLIQERRHCIRRLFDDSYNLIQNNVFKINIKPSIVCYQDTDSNYYKNTYIADAWTKSGDQFVCDPELIDKCMHSMLAHNQLLGGFIKYAIARRPYELGFEGAFIVCRYLNRKKKYYGIKWGDDAELRLTEKFDDERMYDPETGYLILDYSKFWVPKKTVVPQSNGDYIFIDSDKLLHQGVNYLDYVHDQDVKCTGVDLARRDQYNFVNFFHIVVLRKDLRIMKYDGEGDWTTFPLNESMEHIVNEVIETFHQIIIRYQSIANLETDELPEYDFSLIDFAKNSAYRPGKQGIVPQIVKRLKKEGKERFIPGMGERMTFVMLLDETTKQNRENGRAAQTNAGDCSYVVAEILEQLYEKYPREEFEQKKLNNDRIKNLTYEKFIDVKAICLLDIKRYLTCLAKSMSLYIVGDKYPNEIHRIDDGELTPTEAGQLISKLQDKIAKNYVEKYYPHDVKYARDLRTSEKKRAKIKITSNRSELMKRYPEINIDDLTLSQYNQISSDLNQTLEQYSTLLKYCDEIYKKINTDKFSVPKYKNQQKKDIYEKFKNKPEKLMKTIEDLHVRINNVKGCVLALQSVEKMVKPDEKRLERLERIEKENEEMSEFLE